MSNANPFIKRVAIRKARSRPLRYIVGRHLDSSVELALKDIAGQMDNPRAFNLIFSDRPMEAVEGCMVLRLRHEYSDSCSYDAVPAHGRPLPLVRGNLLWMCKKGMSRVVGRMLANNTYVSWKRES